MSVRDEGDDARVHLATWSRWLTARAWSAVVSRTLPRRAADLLRDRGVPRVAWATLMVALLAGALAGFGPLGVRPTAQALRDGGPADGKALDDVVGHLEVAVPARSVPSAPTAKPAARGRRPRQQTSVTRAAAPVQEAASAQPQPRPLVPAGKGMWVYMWERTENGNPAAVVARAKAAAMTTLYVRLGSTKDGFSTQPVLDALLPPAHAAGMKVVGWDFPELDDPGRDVGRAAAMVRYRTPGGDGIDAFSADIETTFEGTNNDPGHAHAYGEWLRANVGPLFPLIATVPRPPRAGYPYAQVLENFDAVAPMVYWMNRDPVADLNAAMDALAPFGKPILPVGQAYDGGPEGGPPGPPPKEAIERFIAAAAARGALGVSFWVWQHATPDHWQAIAASTHWELHPMQAGPANSSEVQLLQRLLASLGYPVAVDGRFGGSTRDVLAAFQQRAGLTPTGDLDTATIGRLLRH